MYDERENDGDCALGTDGLLLHFSCLIFLVLFSLSLSFFVLGNVAGMMTLDVLVDGDASSSFVQKVLRFFSKKGDIL